MPAHTTEKEGAEDDKPVIQRWKWAVIAAVAAPNALLSIDMGLAFGIGVAVGTAVGLTAIIYGVTKAARRTGMSSWLSPRGWKVIAGVSAAVGILVMLSDPTAPSTFPGFVVTLAVLLICGLVVKGLRKGSSKAVSAIR